MPRHVRTNLADGFQKVIDSSWDFANFERLTNEEKKEIQSIRVVLIQLQQRISGLITTVNSRPEANLPQKIGGSIFSWSEHDEVCKRKKLQDKLHSLQAQLRELEK